MTTGGEAVADDDTKFKRDQGHGFFKEPGHLFNGFNARDARQ